MSLVFTDSVSDMKFLNNKDKVGSSIVLLFALIYLSATFDIPIDRMSTGEQFTARSLPIFLSILAIATCLIQIFIPVRGAADETISDAIAGFQWKPCLLLTVSMLVYGLTFQFFGFPVATFLFLFTGFAILKEKRYLLSAAISGGVAVFMWVVLTQVFDIYLDTGDLYRLVAGG
jgi:putative tricarboxylic transport membrane protein